jgi:formate dehydrogenase subunit gamma
VRQDKAHFTNNPANEAGVLIQTGGDAWRHLRNDVVTLYGGWLLLLVVAAIFWFLQDQGAADQP